MVGELGLPHHREPAGGRTRPSIRRSLAACTDLLGLLDERLSGQPTIGGSVFTLADIPVEAMPHRQYELDIERTDTPLVTAWYDRLRQRPACREHMMTPIDELKGRLSF